MLATAASATEDPFSEAALARFRAHPEFRRAVETAARGTVDFLADCEPDFYWMNGDRGRYLIGLAALALSGAGNLTAASLKSLVAAMNVASPGRVAAFLTLMRDQGHLTMTRLPDGGLDRHLAMSARYIDHFRRHRMSVVRGLAVVEPTALGVEAALAGPSYPAIEMVICGVHAAHRSLFQTDRADPMYGLIERTGALTILFDLTLGQAPDRRRLLEETSFSVSGLARRHRVSRVHVKAVLGEMTGQGLARIDEDSGRIIFTPALSEAFERTSALVMIALKQGLTAAGAL
jgi:hypothetical protein